MLQVFKMKKCNTITIPQVTASKVIENYLFEYDDISKVEFYQKFCLILSLKKKGVDANQM